MVSDQAADRTLIVLRHAQAAAGYGSGDAGRPLTGRGRRDAAHAGRELAARRLVPDLVLCSTARRAEQTWQALSRARSPEWKPEVSHDSRIYDASATTLLELLWETDDKVRTVLLVGHNPAVTELVHTLVRGLDPGMGMTTSAFAVIGVAGDWLDITPAAGGLQRFWTPAG
jgi:phosphohistidine phosphatase